MKRAKKLLKRRCFFCGYSAGRLLYCEDTDRYTHRACLFYAFSETGFPGMEHEAGRMAYLLREKD